MSEIKYPAVVMVHWPGKSTPACHEHSKKLYGLAAAMGMPCPTSTPIDEPEECANCVNEAGKR